VDSLRRIRPRTSATGSTDTRTGSPPRRVPIGDMDERNLRLRGAGRRLASALDQLRSGVPLNWGQVEDDPELITLARLQQAGQECRAMPLREPSASMKAALIAQLSARLPAAQAKKEKVVPKSLAGFSEDVPVLTQVDDNINLGVNWPVVILRGAVGLAVLLLAVWGIAALLKATTSTLTFSWIDVRRGGESISHVQRTLGLNDPPCRVARHNNPTRPSFFIPAQTPHDAEASVGYNIPFLPESVAAPVPYILHVIMSSIAPCDNNTLQVGDPAALVYLQYIARRVDPTPNTTPSVSAGQSVPTVGVASISMFAYNEEPVYLNVSTGNWEEVREGDLHAVYWRGNVYRDQSGYEWSGDVSVMLVEHNDTVVTLVGYNSNGVTRQMLTELARNIAW
jgi:hypothetical protein